MKAVQRFNRVALWSLVLTLGWATGWGCAPAPSARAPKVLNDEQRALNVASFDQVWETVKNKHWDPKLNGVNWEAVRDELRPRVESAKTMGEARSVMEEMLGRLRQSHFGIIPAQAYDYEKQLSEPATPKANGESNNKRKRGASGMEMCVIDGQAIVFRVVEGSPAQQAGVRPGWVMTRADKVDVSKVLANFSKGDKKDHMGLMMALVAQSIADGDEGRTMTYGFLDESNRKVTRKITMGPAKGEEAKFGNLPSMFVRFESRRVDGDIHYVHFTSFFGMSIMKGVKEAVEANADAAGFVLDLRGNPGGVGALAMGVGNWFVTAPDQKLGTLITRDSELKFVLNPQPGGFRGPLAILVDERSASTSEILAGGLQAIGRARVFGTTTAGAALPSVIEVLPNGDRFQYAFANYVSAQGGVLEGVGVIPDEVVQLDRASLLEGRDPVMEAAIRWIRSSREAVGRIN